MANRISLLFWCVAAAIVAFAFLNFWSERNAPLPKRLESQWSADVVQLEASRQLPGAWFDVKNLEVIGGTPETKDWLSQIRVPLTSKPTGHFHLEVLVVVWEEDGKRGALVQYTLIDLKTRNTIWELGRTFILSQPSKSLGFVERVKELL